jgi:hypothetical protein
LALENPTMYTTRHDLPMIHGQEFRF